MTALALSPNGVKKPMLSNVFDEWFGNDLLNGRSLAPPKTNIIEFDDHYLIELSVPGCQKSDFKITVDKKLLIVSNIEKLTKNTDEGEYIIKEFSKRKFSKSYSLTPTIDSDKISAKCHDGILSIHLPKKEEAKSKPAVEIKIK